MDGVVEEVVEKLLAQLLLDIVGEGVGVQGVVPEGICGYMALDSIVCWGEEGAAVEAVEGGDEAGTLEEAEEGGVVWVGGEGVNEGGSGRGGPGCLRGSQGGRDEQDGEGQRWPETHGVAESSRVGSGRVESRVRDCE